MTGRRATGFGTQASRTAGALCLAAVCGLPACADIWGFDDLRGAPDSGGIPDTGTLPVVVDAGAAGNSGGVAGAGAGGAVGAEGSGGVTGRGDAGDTSDTSDASDASDARIVSGSGGSRGGGTAGASGSSGTGGALGSGGGGGVGVGGAGGRAGAPGTGGRGTGGAAGRGGAGGGAGNPGTGGRGGSGGTGGCVVGSTHQLLVNPNFESGMTGWTTSVAGGFPLIYVATGNGDNQPEIAAQSPDMVAWFGGYNRADDIGSQSVVIPADATSINLSFFYAIFSRENGNAENDVLDVTVTSGAQTTTVAHFSNADENRAWTRFSTTLPTTLAGQTVRLQFRSVTNAATITSFYVDTVALQVVACP